MEVPTVTYENLFYLLSRGHFSTDRSTEGSGTTVEVWYPGYHGSPVTAQSSGQDRFPPVASGWGTIHLIPDTSPPIQDEEEGPPT
jgi:hypothetical protein